LASGALVAGFGAGGRLTVDATANDDRFSAAIVSGGNLVVSGLYGGLSYTAGSGSGNLQRRSSSTGALDASFAGGAGLTGTASTAISGLAEDASAYYVYGTDYSLGGGDQRVVLAKHDKSTGALVTSFDGDGLYYHNPGPLNDVASGMVLDGSGGVYIACLNAVSSTDLDWRVQKLFTGTGALDVSFATGGQYDLSPSVNADAPYALTLNGGYLYVTGVETLGGLDTQWRVEKLAVGPAPTATHSPTVSPSFTASPAVSPTFTRTVTGSFSPSPSFTVSPTRTATPTSTPSLTPATAGLPEAVDNLGLTFTAGGNATWYLETATTYNGGDAAQSGDINDSQSVYMEASFTGPGIVSFFWSVSSENGYDYLKVAVDGVIQGSGISGAVGWTSNSVSFGSGAHIVRWTYSKDSSVSVGSDAGWVDWIQFTPTTFTPTRTVSATFSASPTFSPTRTISATFSASPTPSPTRTVSPTWTISPTYSPSPSASPTGTPVVGLGLPYTENFDGASPGWTATGLWHAVDTGTANPYALAQSPTKSWWYGQDATGNYSTGATTSGALTSPPIAISGSPTLTFYSWYETESSGTSYDQRWLQISVNGGAFSFVQQFSGEVMDSWGQKSISLAAYNGSTVQLRFYFDSVDSISNTYRGWYVDSLSISVAGAPTSTQTSTRTRTPTHTPTLTRTPSPSATPSATHTVTPTGTATPSITVSSTISPTFSISPTLTISATVTPTPAYAEVRTNKVFSYPNPYKPGPGRLCTLRFQPCNSASVEIFDLAARRVGEIPQSQIKSGSGVAYWDGGLYNGSIAAPGLYFILLRSENGVLTNKLTVIR
jgi:hypothetical protein